MRTGSGGPGFARLTIVATVIALIGASLQFSPARAAPPGPCPPTFPIDELEDGMLGVGYTVVDGTEPVEFNVEILGVQEDGIAPGRDLIVIKATGPPLDAAGGIWYGMSGSPVYIDDKIVGAVAYGFSWGPSKIGGVTPAEDMKDVLEYGGGASSSSTNRVQLSDRMRRRIAREEGTSTANVQSSFGQLKMPVSLSGLNPRGMRRAQRVIKKSDLPMFAYPGGSADAAAEPIVDTSGIKPGSNFAAVLSYGDITYAGIGTTTMVCDGQALAFGHPFFFDGRTDMGVNTARAITIVDDPLFGPYKFATVEDLVGRLDQDRWAAVRANLGAPPTTIPITSQTIALNTLRTRAGQTDVTISEPVPFITLFHLLSNIDTTFDQISEGSSEISWQISGTREDGAPWSLSRSNIYASDWDIAWESVFEVYLQLYILYYNDFEKIAFSGVDIDATVREEVRQYTIIDVLVSKDDGRFRDVERVRVKPGTDLRLKVKLEPYDEARNKILYFDLSVPNKARRNGYMLLEAGGSDEDFYCFFDGDCGNSPNKNTFDGLLKSLQNQPTNNELRARLRLGRKWVDEDTVLLDHVVSGYEYISVRVRDRDGGVQGSEGKY